MQDGAVAERVDEARDAVGVAVDVGLGVIGEERGGTPAASGVVVDLAAGLLQGHGVACGRSCGMRWRTAAKGAYLSNSRSSGWPASTKVTMPVNQRHSTRTREWWS